MKRTVNKANISPYDENNLAHGYWKVYEPTYYHMGEYSHGKEIGYHIWVLLPFLPQEKSFVKSFFII